MEAVSAFSQLHETDVLPALRVGNIKEGLLCSTASTCKALQGLRNLWPWLCIFPV